MHPIIAKLWIGITILIIIIPIGMVLFQLIQKIQIFLNKRANKLEQQKEIAEVKETLEENQDEFITSNEYWSFSSPETSNEEVQNIEEEKEENSEALEEKSEDNSEVSIWEKERKRLETILLEAEHLKRNGKIEEYEQKLIEGLSIDPESLEVLKPLSELYFTLGNYKKAISLLKKVTDKDPSDHKAFWQIWEIYFITGFHQPAELLIEKAINLKNDNPKYYLTMVEIFYNTQRYPEALAYMEKIIKLRPTNPKYLLATAELYEEFSDFENARKYYFNVLEYEPSNEKAKAKIKELSKGI